MFWAAPALQFSTPANFGPFTLMVPLTLLPRKYRSLLLQPLGGTVDVLIVSGSTLLALPSASHTHTVHVPGE
jgi:hypothetical protein